MDQTTPTVHAAASNALGWQPQRAPGMPPLVEQLVQHCLQLLAGHSLRAGTRLPSVRQLADSAGVSRDTVVQAYDRLVAQGVARIPEDRHGTGVVGDLPVWENAVSERLHTRWFSRLGWVRRKAAQGVDVRLIYDDFGSLLGLPTDFVVRMERAHIRCIPFNPVVPLVSLVMNHRDHRKIVVVDGNVAYTGGVNLADEYINAEQRFGYWKDAAIRLEGAAVWNFTVMFLNVWNAFRPQETDYTAFAPTRLPAVQDGVVQPYADSPLDEEPMAETVYLNILAQAQRYVYIYTPYLAVGEEMLDALKNAAKRGVDIRLVLPGIPDKKLVFRLSRSYYLPLVRAGVRIYEYTPGFLHAKCWVSDDVTAVVGSINMDYRSLFLHFECGVLLQKNSQVAVLRDDVRATLPQCREIQVTECRTSLPGTVLDSVLRLLSPLM